jgi:hypothetical protein
MKKKNFHVSIKTVDDVPLFPPSYDGQKLLFPFVMQASGRVGIVTTGFATFPTGVEVIAPCKTFADVKFFADTLSALIYEHNNAIGHVIENLAIHIGELPDDASTLQAFMMDMMMRSMVARGELSDVSDSGDGSGDGFGSGLGDGFDSGSSSDELFSIDIDLNDLDNSKITPLGKPGNKASKKPGGIFGPCGLGTSSKKRHS